MKKKKTIRKLKKKIAEQQAEIDDLKMQLLLFNMPEAHIVPYGTFSPDQVVSLEDVTG